MKIKSRRLRLSSFPSHNGSDEPDPHNWERRVKALTGEIDRAYMVAYRAVHSRVLAEEAVQEAFRQLLERPIWDQGHRKVLAYFLKMVRHEAIALAVKERNQKRREEFHAELMPTSKSTPHNWIVKEESVSPCRVTPNSLQTLSSVSVPSRGFC